MAFSFKENKIDYWGLETQTLLPRNPERAKKAEKGMKAR